MAFALENIMKSKVINFEKGLSGLKHRRGKKESTEENSATQEPQSTPTEIQEEPKESKESKKTPLKTPEVVSQSQSQARTIKFPSKSEKIQDVILELANLQGEIMPNINMNNGNIPLDVLKNSLDNNPAVDRVMELILKLVDLTGYTLEDLLLGGKLQEIITEDNVLNKKFYFEDGKSSKADVESLFNFSRDDLGSDDDDDDEDDENEDGSYVDDGKSRTYYIDGREINITKRLKSNQTINPVRTRIKEIIQEIYDTYRDDQTLMQLADDPKTFRKLPAAKREFVNDYFRLVEELEDLTEHEADDPFVTENLRRLARRYRVKLKF